MVSGRLHGKKSLVQIITKASARWDGKDRSENLGKKNQWHVISHSTLPSRKYHFRDRFAKSVEDPILISDRSFLNKTTTYCDGSRPSLSRQRTSKLQINTSFSTSKSIEISSVEKTVLVDCEAWINMTVIGLWMSAQVSSSSHSIIPPHDFNEARRRHSSGIVEQMSVVVHDDLIPPESALSYVEDTNK